MPDPGAYWCEKEDFEVAGINTTQLKTLAVLLPTLTEQQEIVRRVESLFAKADQIEASYQKLKAKIEQLPQALLAKAFRGELVEQLPTDGDARELLKEILKFKAEKTEKKQIRSKTIANTKTLNKMELEPKIAGSCQFF